MNLWPRPGIVRRVVHMDLQRNWVSIFDIAPRRARAGPTLGLGGKGEGGIKDQLCLPMDLDALSQGFHTEIAIFVKQPRLYAGHMPPWEILGEDLQYWLI